MSDSHIQFETLCALAASGPLPQTELSELRRHADQCAACMERLLQMEHMSEAVFLACALAEPSRGMPKGMRERFVERANVEGIDLRPRTQRVSPLYVPILGSFALLILAATITSDWRGLVSSKSSRAESSQAFRSTDDGRRDLSASKKDRMIIRAEGAPARRVRYRTEGTHSGLNDQTVGSAMKASPQQSDSEVQSEATASHSDFVMYSPQPKFSSESIPSLSMTWGGHALQPWVQRDSVAFDHRFSLREQKPLLQASSDSQYPLAQYASVPNGTLNFRFNPSDFGELQATTH